MHRPREREYRGREVVRLRSGGCWRTSKKSIIDRRKSVTEVSSIPTKLANADSICGLLTHEFNSKNLRLLLLLASCDTGFNDEG